MVNLNQNVATKLDHPYGKKNKHQKDATVEEAYSETVHLLTEIKDVLKTNLSDISNSLSLLANKQCPQCQCCRKNV